MVGQSGFTAFGANRNFRCVNLLMGSAFISFGLGRFMLGHCHDRSPEMMKD
jgi:hypothetical protein